MATSKGVVNSPCCNFKDTTSKEMPRAISITLHADQMARVYAMIFLDDPSRTTGPHVLTCTFPGLAADKEATGVPS